jgi:hypothetical protein
MDIHGVSTEPRKQQRPSLKRAIISAAAALGIKPVGQKWIAAFSAP